MRLLIAALAAAFALAAGASVAATAQGDGSAWAAWVNRMPLGPPSLHVTGVVTLPHGGFDVTLTPASPQGFNPAILMLNLEVAERAGPHAPAPEARGVRYDVENYDGPYTEVTILRGGEMVARVAVGTAY